MQLNQSTINSETISKEFNKKSNNKKSNFLWIFLITIVIFSSGFYIGYAKKPASDKVTTVTNQKTKSIEMGDFEPFWKVWTLIDEKYPNAKNISSQERIWGAIKGLVSSVEDPYSTFFDPQETKEFNEEITGSFSGIGVEIGVKDGLLTVISPLKNSPAEKAGIKAGDAILKVGDKLITEMTIDQSIKLIRGEKGTPIQLTVLRKEVADPIEITVIRDIIDIPTIDEKVIGDVYIISLYNFNSTSAELMHKAFVNFNQSGKKKLIIDLRGNPGGYLESAISIVSDILPQGNVIVSEDFGKAKKQVSHRSRGYGTIKEDVKIALLIDGGSASASEIVSGALKDTKRAVIIGEKSFGKGSVQELISVTKDTSVKITVANWLTPNGTSITEKGIVPDIEVKEKAKTKNDPNDPFIKRALEWFSSGK